MPLPLGVLCAAPTLLASTQHQNCSHESRWPQTPGPGGSQLSIPALCQNPDEGPSDHSRIKNTAAWENQSPICIFLKQN